MHHMKSLSPKRLPMHHTLTSLVRLIPPIHMVKGLMLHSGHIQITAIKLWHFNGLY